MILIISSELDVHARSVLEAFARRGVDNVHLLDLSDFPTRMQMDMRLDNNGHSDFAITLPGDLRVPMEEVTAVWWRRPQMFRPPETVRKPEDRHFILTEAATAFQGMWQASRALWVNNILRDAAAAHKPWQLALAKRTGLSIPETLITNDPEQARAFWDTHRDEVIFKGFTATLHAWRETRRLREADLAFAETIQLAPVIFQRYVPAIVDLRITIIGEQVFAAEAHNEEYDLDVRLSTKLEYRPHALPPDVEDKLLRFMRQLGLEYGAIDMRVTPEGEYVFLEVNPAGQFLYVEHSAGLPISDAMADHLLQGVESPSVPAYEALAG